ncbi:MAG: hypothetical protein CVU88_07130 [Firmicutes bacterium HGW-Firmicutes-13]|nr:MAG: hypothetical protein CVU88_07130 [Firmicutes bacterium HGW-Firmicutes-13]
MRIKSLASSESAPEHKEARILDRFLGDRENVLVGILLCNTCVNVGISALSTRLAAFFFQQWNIDIHYGLLVSIPLATASILLFGEILPKIFSYHHRDSFSFRVARPLHLLLTFLHPFVRVFTWLSLRILLLFGYKHDHLKNRLFIKKDKIFHYLSMAEETGTLDSKENEMLSSLCHFGDLVVKTVMTPRTEMTCLPETLTLEEVLAEIKSSERSRFPVYRKDLDDIVGIFHAKDLMIHHRRIETDGFNIQNILMPCTFIPENKKVDHLLKDFQREKKQIAIVVDEYGGTAGLVTFADILEKIVGEMEENKEESRNIIETAKNSFVIEALTPIDEICEELSIEIPRGDYATLGGLVYDSLGRVPEIDEELKLENGLLLRVLMVDGKKIQKIFLDISFYHPLPVQVHP